MVYGFLSGLAKGVSSADQLARVVFKGPQAHTIAHAEVLHHVRGNACGLLFKERKIVEEHIIEKSKN